MELFLTLLAGMFFFLYEEFSNSPIYSLASLLLPLLVSIPLSFIMFRRGKPIVAWGILGALQATQTAIIRLLLGLYPFAGVEADTGTYFIIALQFALSGFVAGAFIVRRDPKGWLRILPLLGISLGVLYHHQVAINFWSSPNFFGRWLLLFLAQFFAPTIYGWLLSWYAQLLRKNIEKGLAGV